MATKRKRKNKNLSAQRNKARLAMNDAICLKLRMEGLSYPEMSRHPDSPYKSVKGCHLSVQRGLQSITEEAAMSVRRLELARYDRLLRSWWPKAVGHTAKNREGEEYYVEPDRHAAKVVLDLMERRARLLGLDAPIKIDMTDEVNKLAESMGMDPETVRKEAAVLAKQVQLQPHRN